MSDIEISFQWDMALDGYKWTKTKPLDGGKEEWFLTTGHPVDLGYGYMRTRYEPIKEYTGLFMQFSYTEPSREGVLSFASEYGFLKRDNGNLHLSRRSKIAPTRIILPPPTQKEEARVTEGESLSMWLSEIASMNRAVSLWEAVRKSNMERLRTHVKWPSPNKVIYVHPDLDQPVVIADSSFQSERLKMFPPGDVILPAMLFIKEWLNERPIPKHICSSFNGKSPDQGRPLYSMNLIVCLTLCGFSSYWQYTRVNSTEAVNNVSPGLSFHQTRLGLAAFSVAELVRAGITAKKGPG